jgi:PLP dependent protein
MSIESNLRSILRSLPPHVKLVAVSKTRTAAQMMEAYRAGQRAFGENRVWELTGKHPLMPTDTEWHFIGHLQTNKVKQVAPLADVVHSIDSWKLLFELNREAARCGRVIICLLQFHIATEETKYGLDYEEALNILRSQQFGELKNVRIAGVMGMATFTDDRERVREEFRELKRIFDRLKSQFFSSDPVFREISMGMSGDYPVAVEEGSTIVRIGTMVFERKAIDEEC